MHWEPQLASYPLSLDSLHDGGHHVSMTPQGLARLRAKKPGDVLELIPGVDYVVRRGGEGWMSFPDVPSTHHFRHARILARRRRPRAPSFAGTPLPTHRPGEEGRAAAIVMAYFHPWTLRAEGSEEHAPFAGQLRKSEECWQDALCRWLDGKIRCEEARRYVGHFLLAH